MIPELIVAADCLTVRGTSIGGGACRIVLPRTVAIRAAFSPSSATAMCSSFPRPSTSMSGDHSAAETAERLLVNSEVEHD